MLLTASLSRKNRRQAFTLTEAAIVFGVVGIVMAAIWGAVSTVIRKNQINQLVENHGMLVQNILSLHKGKPFSIPNGNYDFFARRAGLVPPAMIKDGGLFQITTMWDTQIRIESGILAPNLFKVYYMSLPDDVCVQLVARVAGPKHNGALDHIEDVINIMGMPLRDVNPSNIGSCNQASFFYNVQG